MIEKKIKYEVNIEKPSKTKPFKQGGVLNYLGKQKTVNAPRHWRSSPKHPIAHLSYITKDEEKILIDLNLYGSLKGKPNRGPFGLPSLQGSGGGSGGDGGGDGGSSGGDSSSSSDSSSSDSSSDSGPGGSDDGTGHGGPGPGDAGPGPGDTFGSSTADDAASNQAASEAAAQAASDEATIGMQTDPAVTETGVMSTVTNAVKNAITNAINNPISTIAGIALGPVGGLAARGIAAAVDAANRGVTAPNDFSQATESVQSGPAASPSDGGIGTMQAYAPLYNSSETTGDSTMDAYIRRLRLNLGLPV